MLSSLSFRFTRVGRFLRRFLALHRLRARLFPLLSRTESEAEQKVRHIGRRKRNFPERERNHLFFFSSTILPIFMPLQQRYLPSAWDRGGLLGPRGNARFLEVDGLRVKYIGRLVILE